MHKKRLRKKMGKQFKAMAIKRAVIESTIAMAEAYNTGYRIHPGVALSLLLNVRMRQGGWLARMSSTSYDYFYRKHFGLPEIQRRDIKIVSVNPMKYGELGPIVHMDVEGIRGEKW